MATPSSLYSSDAMSQIPSPSSASGDGGPGNISRRQMRVKILYTFDDQNKSNCLARLPNVLNIAVVSLDENTEVGVIELKTCIQAIVTASPELVAKLEHDYTVYAYDFSEYETPLVGQGMLSWILASASITPNAPAEHSQTMVTGRVCKNLIGIFSNGVKDTLEVKLKLVPVPTSMQKEYVENMERYHSLSQLMPEGFDYSVWSDFLKENPTLGQLAQPTFDYPAQLSPSNAFGGVDSLHQMLTRQNSLHDLSRNNSLCTQSPASFHQQITRASSPAGSTVLFKHYEGNPETRPASRASVRGEAPAPPQQFPFSDPFVMEEREDGPPKKRARIMQTKRPKKTPLTAQNDSLRVTASTAASVRLHRPALSNCAVTADLVPRAPTPRPGDGFGSRGQRRLLSTSGLRHASTDMVQSYTSPYDSTSFSDNGADSMDERGSSPGETSVDIPSSPPIILHGGISPTPSSPPLPTLPLQTDSGFVSDVPTRRDDDGLATTDRNWEGSDLPLPLEEKAGPRQNKSRRPWQHVQPGPVDRLPQSYVPQPKQPYRKQPAQLTNQTMEQEIDLSQPMDLDMLNDAFFNSPHLELGPMDFDLTNISQDITQPAPDGDANQVTIQPFLPSGTAGQPLIPNASHANSKGIPQPARPSQAPATSRQETQPSSRSATPVLPAEQPKMSKLRHLPRSNTWSGTADPISEVAGPADQPVPRSGSGARRKKNLQERLEKAIAAGEMPPHCANCGEIDTPTWRKAYSREEVGNPKEIQLSTNTSSTDIIAFQVIEAIDGHEDEQKYKIFKNNLSLEEKAANFFEAVSLCNPCGLWLVKKAEMRPQAQWDKPARLAKRRRNQGAATRSISMTQGDDLMSDAVLPESDIGNYPGQGRTDASLDGTQDAATLSRSARRRSTSFQAAAASTEFDEDVAHAALRRAIQSSPAALGSRTSPIDVEADFTPKPTRRLLFSSPHKAGETKSLSTGRHGVGVANHVQNHLVDQPLLEKPRCQRCKAVKKKCDRERPCGRCDNAGIGYDGCIPCEPPRTNWFEHPIVQTATVEEQADKENCPPPLDEEDDGLRHLFEDGPSPKATPKKDQVLQELLKTPTPDSRHRNPLTPKRGTETADLLMTPSRIILTPRGNRAVTVAPDTPFTRQLNALLSDCPMSSPSCGINLFPSFTTPGRDDPRFADFLNDDFLSSDMPTSSSPNKGIMSLGFDLYEDPNTSTAGLWSESNIIGHDAVLPTIEGGSKQTTIDGPEVRDAATFLNLTVGGITVDFAAMIEEVVSGANNKDGDDIPRAPSTSPEAQSQGLATTPEDPSA